MEDVKDTAPETAAAEMREDAADAVTDAAASEAARKKKKTERKVLKFRDALALFAAGYPAGTREKIGRNAWNIYKDKTLRKIVLNYAVVFRVEFTTEYTCREKPFLGFSLSTLKDKRRAYSEVLEDLIFDVIEKDEKKHPDKKTDNLKGLKAAFVVFDGIDAAEMLKRMGGTQEPAGTPANDAAAAADDSTENLAEKIVEAAGRQGMSKQELEAKIKTLTEETTTAAARIKDLMEKKGMDSRTLAERCGITEVSMSRFLQGDRLPGAIAMVNIATALNTTVAYLLGRSDDPAAPAADPEAKK